MTPNKLYAQCREEAARQMIQKNSHLPPPIAAVLCYDEIKQLTAEIYGQKLLEFSHKENDVMYSFDVQENTWLKTNYYGSFEHIGTTKQFHDYLLKENEIKEK